MGGQFKDGVVNSLMSGVASEIGVLLHAEIARTPNLSEPETSALRLLARATESALRVAANPEDKGYAFASDFLTSMLDSVFHNGASQSEAEDTAEEALETSTEASTPERGNRFDDEIFMERDPYLIDIASMNGKELAARAGIGMELLKDELRKSGRELIAKEVYFLPDGAGMKYIKIDGVYIDNDKIQEIKTKKVVSFFEVKTGNGDLTKNQKTGLPKLQEGKGVFYGKEAAKIAGELGITPDANSRFRIPAERISGPYIVTYGRTIPRTKRMNQLGNKIPSRLPPIRGSGI